MTHVGLQRHVGGWNFQDSVVVCLHEFQFKTLVGETTMLP